MTVRTTEKTTRFADNDRQESRDWDGVQWLCNDRQVAKEAYMFKYLMPTFLLLFAGCDNEGIGWPFAYNKETNKCVVTAGPVIQPTYTLDIDGRKLLMINLDLSKSKLYVIDLDKRIRDRTPQQIYNSEATALVSWRPRSHELYLFKNDSVNGRCEVYRVNLEQKKYIAERIAIYEGFSVLSAEWNPDGSLIAMSIMRDEGLKRAMKGEKEDGLEYAPPLVGYSFDKCNTLQVSDISFRTHQITWLSGNLFSIVSDGRVLVIDVNEAENSLAEKDVIGTSEDHDAIRLIGSMDGKVVYRIEGKIYLDKELIYSTDKFYRGIADGGAILIMLMDNTGFVLNYKGEITNSFIVDDSSSIKDDIGEFLGFSPHRNTFFLINSGKNITAHDYSKNETPRVLFSVDMFNVRSN